MSDLEENGRRRRQREYTDEEMHALIDGTITDFDDGRPRLRHGRQGRARRGPARHRLQVRRRHPGARALDPQGRQPRRHRAARRSHRGPRSPEGGQGRPPDPVQEARRVRARLGQGRGEVHLRRERRGRGHRGRQGRSHPRHRPARLPARLARRPAARQGPRGLHRPRASRRGSSRWTATATTSCCRAASCSKRAASTSARTSSTKLQKGRSCTGTVSSIVDFGAFVDLGGIDGLVHISELSWSHVNHPCEVVEVGDPVEVMVLDVDLSRERISLGLKQTTGRPVEAARQELPDRLDRRGHA